MTAVRSLFTAAKDGRDLVASGDPLPGSLSALLSESPADETALRQIREPLRVELESFRDAVLAGGPAAVTAHDGIVALAVAEALVASSHSGEPVTVDEVSLTQ